MNRPIEFRAWHIPTKRIFDVFSWCKDCVFEDSNDGVGTSPTLPAEMEDCVLMQFTGLYDINGKEIYEGDYISFRRKLIYTVVFIKGAFYLTHKNGTKEIDGSDYVWGLLSDAFGSNFVVEIIGNIYEKI